MNLSANLSWEQFLCSVFMTRACRAYRLVPENAENILLKLLKGEFEAICYKDSNGSVALEKMMNTSHFKCPLLQIQYLRAEKV